LGKKIVIMAFLVSFVIALFIFFTYEHKSLRDNLGKISAREPRASLEDFVVYRYAGETIKGKFSARFGNLFEPNVIEVDGEIKAERLTPRGDVETAAAESATAYFKTASLARLLHQAAEFDRAELMGFVEVRFRDHVLTTDYAEFLNDLREVRSIRPVRVDGPGRIFRGEDGFIYNLNTQSLEMRGLVRGEAIIAKKG